MAEVSRVVDHALTESLVRSAAELMSCRTEQQAFERAADALHARGYSVTVSVREGEHLVHATLRHDLDALRAAEAHYGRPMSEVRLELAAFPQAHRVFVEGRAVFHDNVHGVVERIHAPEVAAMLRRAFPKHRAIDAPIPAGGRVYGMLSIFGDHLTLVDAAVLELFAQMLGAAVENVRHHQKAEDQLARMAKLQEELLVQERLAMLGEAAGVLAHEVRNPLGVIRNGITILRMEPAQKSDRSTLALAMMDEELERLDALVGDVLQASRPLDVRLASCELASFVRAEVPAIWSGLGPTRPRLKLDVAEVQAEIESDEGLLRLAIEKLLQNAIAASPADAEVRVAVAQDDGLWWLSIEDQGSVVSPEQAARLFRPFNATRASGSGLALTVVQRVAAAHGAVLEAKGLEPCGLRIQLGFARKGAPTPVPIVR